jgi:hypothetical protein
MYINSTPSLFAFPLATGCPPKQSPFYIHVFIGLCFDFLGLDSACEISHALFAFLSLAYFVNIHFPANDIILFFFMAK